MENSFLFEGNNRGHVGFDFSTLRLVRVRGINGFDAVYSLQGSVQKVSLSSIPRYIKKNEGIEKDVTTDPLEWSMAFWKLHTITGAVVARTLVDRSGSQNEGFSPITDAEFEAQLGHGSDIVRRLPAQKDIEIGKVTSPELREEESQLNDILLGLTDAWLMGNLSKQQRERLAALNYLDHLKRYELGWYHPTTSDLYSEMTNQDYKENAEDWLTEEMKWGSDLRAVLAA